MNISHIFKLSEILKQLFLNLFLAVLLSIRYLFINYLKGLKNSEVADNRRKMVVDDPSRANVFIIEHDWLRMNWIKCHINIEQHLTPVINNVVDNYPYYNLSNGRDHFFLALFDHGILCEADCANNSQGKECDDICSKNPIARVVARIANASFIGNYGMDSLTFHHDNGTLRSEYSMPCHRIDRDIVIPQIVPDSFTHKFYRYFDTHIPHRKFDSVFSGLVYAWRRPLQWMADNNVNDYIEHGTEWFEFEFGGMPAHDLLHKAIFSWSPCGRACWSRVSNGNV